MASNGDGTMLVGLFCWYASDKNRHASTSPPRKQSRSYDAPRKLKLWAQKHRRSKGASRMDDKEFSKGFSARLTCCWFIVGHAISSLCRGCHPLTRQPVYSGLVCVGSQLKGEGESTSDDPHHINIRQPGYVWRSGCSSTTQTFVFLSDLMWQDQ